MRAQNLIALQTAVSSTDSTPSGTPIVASVQAASFNSGAVFMGRNDCCSIQVSCPSTGTPLGTVAVQVSNDPSLHDTDQPDSNITNWTTMPLIDPTTGVAATTQALSGASTLGFDYPANSWRWLRVQYTRTSGTGTFTMYLQFKGTN